MVGLYNFLHLMQQWLNSVLKYNLSCRLSYLFKIVENIYNYFNFESFYYYSFGKAYNFCKNVYSEFVLAYKLGN